MSRRGVTAALVAAAAVVAGSIAWGAGAASSSPAQQFTITLSPAQAWNLVGTPHVVTATLTSNASPLAGAPVKFTVQSGPNAGTTATVTTGSAGTASFSYVGNTPGLDLIFATFVDHKTGTQQVSHTIKKSWYKKPVLDHYLCYGIDHIAPAFAATSVVLNDQFGMRSAPVTAPVELCNPVKKTRLGTGQVYPPLQPVLRRLVCHSVPPTLPAGSHHVVVVDQFGTRQLTTGATQRLCLPSSARRIPPLLPPPGIPAGLSHYLCYRVSGPGAGSVPVKLDDSFWPWTTQAKVLDPTLLCTPTRKKWLNNPWTTVPNPKDHLVCYTLSLGGALGAKSFSFRNQFSPGSRKAYAHDPRWLCAPAVKIPIS